LKRFAEPDDVSRVAVWLCTDEALRQDLESCGALAERLTTICTALFEETATLSIDSLKL
jgi:hypothetical protein